MIVVGVIGVLALIAYPQFAESVRKGRRADAMAGLLRLQQSQERYRGSQPVYASAVASMPDSPPSDSPERHYTLTIDEFGAGGYKMSATAKSGSPQYADTKCRRLMVWMHDGTVETKSFDASNAEDTTNANRCWVR